MMQNTVAKFLRRWRSQYHNFSSATASLKDVHKTISPMDTKKFVDSLVGFGFQAGICGVGYTIATLTLSACSERFLEYEKALVLVNRVLDFSQVRIEKEEKETLEMLKTLSPSFV